MHDLRLLRYRERDDHRPSHWRADSYCRSRPWVTHMPMASTITAMNKVDHRHNHDPGSLHAGVHGRTVKLEQDLLAKNQLVAERNRGRFEGREILAVNLMSSPGAGKTTLLEKTIGALDQSASRLCRGR